MRWLERLVKRVTRLGTIRGLGSEINVTTTDHTTPTPTARPFEFLKRNMNGTNSEYNTKNASRGLVPLTVL